VEDEVPTKRCTQCHRDLPLDRFAKSGKYLRSACKECGNAATRKYGQRTKPQRNARLREWRRNNPQAAKAKDLRARLVRKYGLTPDEVASMRESQDARCLLCDAPDRELVVDHCHDTGRVRGLLCRSCNTIVGQVEMAPVVLDRLRDYLVHGAASELAISNSTSA
jgi:hypothetical protein